MTSFLSFYRCFLMRSRSLETFRLYITLFLDEVGRVKRVCVTVCLLLPGSIILLLRGYEACHCHGPKFKHFPSLSVPGWRKEWMEIDCISFQQTVTLWVSVEQKCFQEANRQLLVSLSFFSCSFFSFFAQ